MTPATNSRLPQRRLILYALPAFVVALPTIPVYIHLPALYGVELGLGLAATGLFLLLARLFDTVSDPVIGYLSDRYGFRGVRRLVRLLLVLACSKSLIRQAMLGVATFSCGRLCCMPVGPWCPSPI